MGNKKNKINSYLRCVLQKRQNEGDAANYFLKIQRVADTEP